jgi:hypothetical protein
MVRPRTRSVVNSREYFQGEMYVHDDNDTEDVWMTLVSKSNSNSTPSEGYYSTTDDEEENDDLDSRRVRSCSHERRISFDDEVNVVEIPSRDSYDEEHKRQMWYSAAEFDQMRMVGDHTR